MATTDELQIIREPERKRLTGISRVTQWRLERKGLAPKRVSIGDNSIGWLKSEIQEWIRRKADARCASRFQPFTSRVGVDEVIKLEFEFAPALISRLKALLEVYRVGRSS